MKYEERSEVRGVKRGLYRPEPERNGLSTLPIKLGGVAPDNRLHKKKKET